MSANESNIDKFNQVKEQLREIKDYQEPEFLHSIEFLMVISRYEKRDTDNIARFGEDISGIIGKKVNILNKDTARVKKDNIQYNITLLNEDNYINIISKKLMRDPIVYYTDCTELSESIYTIAYQSTGNYDSAQQVSGCIDHKTKKWIEDKGTMISNPDYESSSDDELDEYGLPLSHNI